MTHVTTDDDEAPIQRIAIMQGVEPAATVTGFELHER